MTTNGAIALAIICVVLLFAMGGYGIRSWFAQRDARKEARARDGAMWVEHTEFREGKAFIGMRCIYEWRGEKKVAGFASLGKPIDLTDTEAVEQARNKAAETALSLNQTAIPWSEV